MADNVSINTGSTINIAAENITVSGSATLLQRIKMALGAYDVDGGDVSSTNPMPVTGSTSILSLPAITGSVSIITMPTITGSTTIVSMPAITGSVTVVNTESTIVVSVSSVVSVTGSTSIVTMPAITGSVTVIGALPAITGSTTIVSSSVILPFTGSVTVIGALPAISGSTTIVSSSVILPVTGSVTVIGSLPAVTGSVTLVGTSTVTGSVTQVNIQYPSSANATINPTTAGTSIIIPSTAANSIYVTDLVISNGLTAGTIYLGYGKAATAPTGAAIEIQTLYFAANGGMVWSIVNPIKLPTSNCFICTVASAGAISITATYYVAP